MRCSSSILRLIGSVGISLAVTHDLIVGTFSKGRLHTVRFDDETLTLERVGTTSMPYPNSWLALSHDKKHLYGTAFNANPPGFISYTLKSSTSIHRHDVIYAGGDCNGSAIYVEASPYPPYTVYGTFFWRSAGCGTVLSVDAEGVLNGVVQNFTYEPLISGVHGTALSPDGGGGGGGSRFLYSADVTGNAIWAHRLDPETGRVVEQVARLAASPAYAHPRHVIAHPGGRYLYVVYEGSSEVAQYDVADPGTGIPSFGSDSGGVRYPLLRPHQDPADFWADEVALSASGAYLWATNRAYDNVGGKGYISAFSLDAEGAIVRQNFLLETTTSGGWANSVAPSPFSDRFVALTDNSTGLLQIWSLDEDGNGASVAATLEMPEGCCANAVWYS